MTNNKVILEDKIRFSDSALWKEQKKYYGEKGIEAWNDDVPFYITSNPFIARAYALMTIHFIQDYITQHPESIKSPFIILELGAGTGQFSFYFLKNLLAFQKELKLESVLIQYVMSDLSTRPFDFWEKHPALQDYLNCGVLDFSVYDLYHSDHILLHRSKKKITPLDIKNPLIIVANYLFDSVGTDVFSVSNGRIHESLVTIQTDENNNDNGRPKDWQKTEIIYTEVPIEKNYYHNEFDTILFDYQKSLTDTHFQFPIASLIALKNLQAFSNGRFLLLTSDKGCATVKELDNCNHPELDFHGSFSVMVNYHAMAEFLKKYQGQSITQSFRENIISGVFSCGFSFDDLLQFQFSAKQTIQGFSPTDYFIIYEHVTEHASTCSLEVMASYLNLSNWDPYVFDQFFDRLADLLDGGDAEVVSYLIEHMPLIAANFYYLPAAEDTFFHIGVFFQNIDRFDEALTYYHESLKYFGENDVTLFNMGMCFSSEDRDKEALVYFERAYAYNPEAHDAKEWVDKIKNKKRAS
ncbi:MAG: tetratricopeptide repeat protein [Gammaproteobacteria bacterium]|nr:tetratricopeptide repeat protein [Gammaproteobacteria bacterium]